MNGYDLLQEWLHIRDALDDIALYKRDLIKNKAVRKAMSDERETLYPQRDAVEARLKALVEKKEIWD